MLRYDGLYISKLPVDYGAMLSYSYLRFFEDRTVIESSIRGERSTGIMSWFEKSDGSISSCTYEVDGSSLQFSVTSDSGTVDYSGRVVDGDLHLHSFSRINGNEANDEYEFFGAT